MCAARVCRPADGPLQPALASGEALCDTVNVFLVASGLKPIKPERKAARSDLFEDKNWKIVLKNIHGLARRCHYDVPGFWGPNIGIRKKNRTGGGGLAASMAAAAPVESSMKELMTRGASASIAPLPKGLQDVKDESKLRTESL